MKLTAILALFSVTIVSVSAHSSMIFPPPRGHPRNPNAVNPDFDCITAPYNGGASCPAKPFPCGGYAQDKQIVTTFKAGQVIDVRFTNPNFSNPPDPSTAGNDQARHDGGLCEFALSYNGGNTFTKIATYTKGCPDIFFGFKVKIPDSAPTCDTPGKCIFSWSWINAVGNREFYQNCADVKIVGTSTAPLPTIDITKANLPPFGNTLTPPGDVPNTGNTKGSGPTNAETQANLNIQVGGSAKSSSGTTSGTTGGSSSGSSSGSTGSTTGGTTGGSTSGSTSGSTGGSTGGKTGGKTGGRHGKKGGNKGGSTGTSKQTPIATPSDGTCSNEGGDTCVSSGTSPAFNTCDHGQQVSRQCPSGTVCTTSGDSIVCAMPKRRFIQRRIKINHNRV